jgi:hypothetical protein
MQRYFGSDRVTDKKCTSQGLLCGTGSAMGCAVVRHLVAKNKLQES